MATRKNKGDVPRACGGAVLAVGQRRGFGWRFEMATELLGTVLKDTAGLKAGDVVYAKKQKDGWTVTRKGDKKMDVQLEDGKSFQEFPVVDPAEDPARNLNSIEIVPMQWFLSESPLLSILTIGYRRA